MKKGALVIFLSVVIGLAGTIIFNTLVRDVHAQSVVNTPSEREPEKCKVPKSYGTAKLVTSSLVGFEDSNGTLRWVNFSPEAFCVTIMVIERE